MAHFVSDMSNSQEFPFSCKIEEFDICIDETHNVLHDDTWSKIMQRITNSEFSAIVMAPPCSTWSRAVWSNKHGPQPVRSSQYPFGFPWLTGQQKIKAEAGTQLVLRTLDAALAAHELNVPFLIEHPEYLGTCQRGDPASIWMLKEMRALADSTNANTVVFHQCQFADVDVAKPTRLISTCAGLSKLGFSGWPKLSKSRAYLGPLPRTCCHNNKHAPLIGTNANGEFVTATAAAWPPSMCKAIAELMLQEIRTRTLRSPSGGGQDTNASDASIGRNADLQMDADESDAEKSECLRTYAVDPNPCKLLATQRQGLEEPQPLQSQVISLGKVGRGAPSTTILAGKRRTFTDGAGLCSPGRWPPERRRTAVSDPDLVIAQKSFSVLSDLIAKELDYNKVLCALATGRCAQCPIPDAVLQKAKAALLSTVGTGAEKDQLERVPDNQPFSLYLISELLRRTGDPDWQAYATSEESFAKGVALGVDTELPHIPLVFPDKNKWRSYDEDDFRHPEFRHNYPLVSANADEIEKQFEAEAKLGAMCCIPLEEAKKLFGDRLVIASLGAVKKPDGSYRVLHDGTHATSVNAKIKVRSTPITPTAADLKTMIQNHPFATFSLCGDISRAHRLVLIRPQDWGWQACATHLEKGEVWVNRVGTFGIASAAFHWARLLSGILRFVYYMWETRAVSQMVFVDDMEWIADGPCGMRCILVGILFMVAVGVPFAWHKFKGGIEHDWIGFRINLRERSVGLGPKRAEWLRHWLLKTINGGLVRIADMVAVQGRIMFASTALEILRPFLGPVYAWTSAVHHLDVLDLPAAIRLVLEFILKVLQSGRVSSEVPEPIGTFQDRRSCRRRRSMGRRMGYRRLPHGQEQMQVVF